MELQAEETSPLPIHKCPEGLKQEVHDKILEAKVKEVLGKHPWGYIELQADPQNPIQGVVVVGENPQLENINNPHIPASEDHRILITDSKGNKHQVQIQFHGKHEIDKSCLNEEYHHSGIIVVKPNGQYDRPFVVAHPILKKELLSGKKIKPQEMYLVVSVDDINAPPFLYVHHPETSET